jgi:hypothetical protein
VPAQFFRRFLGLRRGATNVMIVAAAFWGDQANSDLRHSELVLNAPRGT